MPWTKPDFMEITLGMEATAYVNTDESVVSGQWSVVSCQLSVAREEDTVASSLATDH